jgi:hypothetical protein
LAAEETIQACALINKLQKKAEEKAKQQALQVIQDANVASAGEQLAEEGTGAMTGEMVMLGAHHGTVGHYCQEECHCSSVSDCTSQAGISTSSSALSLNPVTLPQNKAVHLWGC